MKYIGRALGHLKKILSKVFPRGKLSKLEFYTETLKPVNHKYKVIWHQITGYKKNNLRYRTGSGPFMPC